MDQERWRAELLAAAEQEAAAILEDARREITVTARRAHRDLLLIRAQLRLCGIEPGQIGATGLDAPFVEPQASLESADLPLPVAIDENSRDSARNAVTMRPHVRTLTKPSVVAAGVLMLFVAVGAGWRYAVPVSAPVAPAAQRGADPVRPAGGSAERGTGINPSGSSAERGAGLVRPAADAGEGTATSPSRIVLQTLRPVWMRLDVDGSGDAGRLYAAGETKALNPRQTLLIRAGDAGAVMLAVNGAPPAALGSAGQVITRRISIGGDAVAAAGDPSGSTAPAAPVQSLPPPVR